MSAPGDLEVPGAFAEDFLRAMPRALSHDARAPLRHIRAYLQVIREDHAGELSAAVAGHLQTIDHAAARAMQMLDALVEWSQIGQPAFVKQVVPLQSLLHGVQEELDAQRSKNGGTPISWQIAPDLPPVAGHAELLGRALHEIMANAAKFSSKVASPCVDISWHAHDHAPGGVTLVIRDNGAGFEPRFVDQLCQPFARLHSASEFEGLGMGLAVAHKILTLHGASLEMAGSVGGGCVVKIGLLTGARGSQSPLT